MKSRDSDKAFRTNHLFVRGGSRISQGGVNLLFGQISPKLHENEENWTEGEGIRNFSM